MGNKQAILLLSGGIDSTTLLAKLSNENYEVVAVSFHYGQKQGIELNYAKNNAEKYGVKKHHIIELDKTLFKSSALVNCEIDITTYKNNELPEGQVNAYVPFRNLLFISTALSLAETMKINEVYLAFNSDDNANFWDCRTDFVEKINAIANSNTSIQIKTPFINFSKTQVVRLARQLSVDLNNTITCYQPNKESECGVCLSCVTKQKAIENA
ncbi:MAG: 7-cyano-7-deazaguanine synthase QueC [Cyclobacteriaceae bacterium]|nr:7-cyano-7-deazaguanine synthase QueC [Cyclobacteriaceae bacterium]